jgi:beta-lactamase class A
VGQDLGWAHIVAMRTDTALPTTRSPVNGEISMLSTATEMVHWYQQALTGQFFTKPESLTEFKRIQAMADAIPLIVPAGIAAYAKGGSIDWNNFHCFSVAGQMIVNVTPVTFAFTINWTGPDEGIPAIFKDFGASLAAILKAATVSLRA